MLVIKLKTKKIYENITNMKNLFKMGRMGDRKIDD